MKKIFLIAFFLLQGLFFNMQHASAQCSICSKTTQQMGDKPARGFYSGIVYLMLTPFAIMGFVGYKWWKGNQEM